MGIGNVNFSHTFLRKLGVEKEVFGITFEYIHISGCEHFEAIAAPDMSWDKKKTSYVRSFQLQS